MEKLNNSIQKYNINYEKKDLLIQILEKKLKDKETEFNNQLNKIKTDIAKENESILNENQTLNEENRKQLDKIKEYEQEEKNIDSDAASMNKAGNIKR